jgi:predicted transglutaminase-like cysteine proteinase
MRSVWIRRLTVALVAAITLLATAAEAQMFRMDALAIGARPNEPFGRSTDVAPAGPLWIKWRGFEADLAKADEAVARCRAEPSSCSHASEFLVALIDEARAADGRRQLGVVNRAINLAVAYASDLSQHGVNDVWSGPLATLAESRGDCEDYAIAKMFVLRAAGVADSDMRLLIAHNSSDGDAHAVLSVRYEGRWLILDNRRMALLDDDNVRDLKPLFAIDMAGVRQFGAPVLTVAAKRVQPAPAPNTTAALGGLLPLLM